MPITLISSHTLGKLSKYSGSHKDDEQESKGFLFLSKEIFNCYLKSKKDLTQSMKSNYDFGEWLKALAGTKLLHPTRSMCVKIYTKNVVYDESCLNTALQLRTYCGF